jgi:predicted oxidoreductase
MHLSELDKEGAKKLIDTALEAGINFFDHANVYGGGKCETLFAEAVGMNSSVREKFILQSKCGIRKGNFSYYDFSKAHILEAVDDILTRLHTEYLDVLLLHRPDALMEPEEVAAAFDTLEKAGKVRHFGVSNQNPMQIDLLKKCVKQPIVANQMQFSIVHTPMLNADMLSNTFFDCSISRDGAGTLNYCHLHDITIQAWSPFQIRFFEGVFLGDTKNYPELNKIIDRLADKYNVPKEAIAVAWITRHPANMQVILGTTKPQRLIDSCKGSELAITKEEWYELYIAAGNAVR